MSQPRQKRYTGDQRRTRGARNDGHGGGEDRQVGCTEKWQGGQLLYQRSFLACRGVLTVVEAIFPDGEVGSGRPDGKA